MADTMIMKKSEILQELQSVTETQSEQMLLEKLCNCADRLSQCRVPTDSPFVEKKNVVSVKHNKTRYACIWKI